jgi:hypothetical protein
MISLLYDRFGDYTAQGVELLIAVLIFGSLILSLGLRDWVWRRRLLNRNVLECCFQNLA